MLLSQWCCCPRRDGIVTVVSIVIVVAVVVTFNVTIAIVTIVAFVLVIAAVVDAFVVVGFLLPLSLLMPLLSTSSASLMIASTAGSSVESTGGELSSQFFVGS